jgi:hypothetical protein
MHPYGNFHAMNPFFIIVPFGILAILLAIFGSIAARKRREALQAWAAGHGLAFDPSNAYDFDDRLGREFSCLRTGDHRHANNIMQGRLDGRPVLAFDYHYETHSTDSKGNRQTHHHSFSAVAIGPPFPLKDLLIRHETLFDKIGAFVGGGDINFESAEFSRKYYVAATDRKWAYDVLHARAIEFLLGRPEFSIQFGEQWALAWNGSDFDAAGFEAAAGNLAGLFDLLPEYVLKQYGAQAERSV